MPESYGVKKRNFIILLGVLTAICVAVLFAYSTYQFRTVGLNVPANAILVIEPYKYGGIWVFDDSRAGLVREPFVANVTKMMDKLVEDIPNAEGGFRLIFSARQFPGYDERLIWRRSEGGGNWYYSEKHNMEGWLCPALSRYFRNAPKEIYVKAEAK